MEESRKETGNGLTEFVEYKGEQYRLLTRFYSENCHTDILIIRNEHETLQVTINELQIL